MDYVKHYVKLIVKAKNRVLGENEYSETHHIIPKSIYSSKVAHKTINMFEVDCKYGKKNRIKLLPQEHYVAHMLLVKMFEGTDTNCYEKMVYAAGFMNSRINNNKKYAFARRKYAEVLSKDRMGKPSGMSGKKWSEERKKLGNVLKGKTYEEMYGFEKAQELKALRKQNREGKTAEEIYGVKRAKEIKKKISNRFISEECRRKNSEWHKGRKLDEEHRQKIKEFMSNDKKNPSVNQTLYRFKNVKTGEIVVARQYDMEKRYGCVLIHRIMRDKTKTTKGWSFLGKAK